MEVDDLFLDITEFPVASKTKRLYANFSVIIFPRKFYNSQLWALFFFQCGYTRVSRQAVLGEIQRRGLNDSIEFNKLDSILYYFTPVSFRLKSLCASKKKKSKKDSQFQSL